MKGMLRQTVGFSHTLYGFPLNKKFVKELPNAQLQWIEECGHVPHLEQPKATAEAIASFLTMSTPFKPGSKTRDVDQEGRR
jgi:hypothetical protein